MVEKVSESENERIVREAFAMYNRGDVDAFLDLFAEDATYVDPFGYVHDREGFRRILVNGKKAFTDRSWLIERMVSQGHTVWVESTWTATHRGTYLWTPATNKTVQLQTVSIIDVKAGKVKLWKEYENMLRLKLALRRALLRGGEPL